MPKDTTAQEERRRERRRERQRRIAPYAFRPKRAYGAGRQAVIGDADYDGPDYNPWGWRMGEAPRGEGHHMIERSQVRAWQAAASPRYQDRFDNYDQNGTPRYYFRGTPRESGAAHARIHRALQEKVGHGAYADRPGIFASLLYNVYKTFDRGGIRGDLWIPDRPGVIPTCLKENVVPSEAFVALLRYYNDGRLLR